MAHMPPPDTTAPDPVPQVVARSRQELDAILAQGRPYPIIRCDFRKDAAA